MKVLYPLLLAMAAVPAFGQTPRDERWRQDLQELARTAAAVHPNLFANVARGAFEKASEELSASIPAKSDAEVVLGLSQLLAMAGDVHTSLPPIQAASPIRRFPLRLYWFQDGLHATDASAAYVRALGRKLVRIEDTPAEEAATKLRLLISAENDWRIRSAVPGLLVSPEALVFAGIAHGVNDPVRYTFAGPDGEFTLAVSIATATFYSLPQKARPNPPLYRRYPERFYWFEHLEASRTLYIKYNVCQESPVLGMEAFARELSEFSESHPYRNAVIDLRNNQGGNSAVIQPLLRGLGAALAAGALTRERLFAIIGRDTVSSGMMAAIDVKRLGATLVGEPTGNRPNHFGNIRTLTLPNSGLAWSCSTRTFVYPEYSGDAVPPDLDVPLSSADFFEERDPALERILAGPN